jgi:hypothetical protein
MQRRFDEAEDAEGQLAQPLLGGFDSHAEKRLDCGGFDANAAEARKVVCLSVCLFVCLSARLSVSVVCLTVCLIVCLFLNLSVRLSLSKI